MRSLLLLLSLTPVLVASAPSSTSAATPNPTVCGDITKRTGKSSYPCPLKDEELTTVTTNQLVVCFLQKRCTIA